MLSERLILLSAAFCAAAAAVIPLSSDITASSHSPSIYLQSSLLGHQRSMIYQYESWQDEASTPDEAHVGTIQSHHGYQDSLA